MKTPEEVRKAWQEKQERTQQETEEMKRARALEFDDHEGAQRTAIRLDLFLPDIVIGLHAIARALDRIADSQWEELEYAKRAKENPMP